MFKNLKYTDKPLLISTLVLFILGLIMVFSASNVTAVQSAIADYTEVGAINAVKANKAGTVVGAVFNNSGAAQQIKFEGVGNPAFLFYAPSTIVVNNIGVGTKNLNNKTGNYKYDYTQGNGAAWAN